MEKFTFDAATAKHGTFNPLETADCESIASLLRQLCSEGLSAEDQTELDDQIEAVVPALVELRDGGHLNLNFATVAEYATLDGFMRLAGDDRLTSLSRSHCIAIRNRMVALGVKAFLGHI